MMFRYTLAALMVFIGVQAQQAVAGPAPVDTATAQYDPATGEIYISVNSVINWFVQSASFGLTGAEPVNVPIIAGTLLSNNDEIIGETGFADGTIATDINLGPVAATGLDLSDLTINWNAGLGQLLESAPVTMFGGVVGTPPIATINGPFEVNIGFGSQAIELVAGTSAGDAPFTYRWDLDGDGSFEIDGGSSNIFNVADVVSEIGDGSLGVHNIAVQVSNAFGDDTAGTTVTLIPEPGTLALACMGLIGIASTRRRRSC